jgi:hypothetical protein
MIVFWLKQWSMWHWKKNRFTTVPRRYNELRIILNRLNLIWIELIYMPYNISD